MSEETEKTENTDAIGRPLHFRPITSLLKDKSLGELEALVEEWEKIVASPFFQAILEECQIAEDAANRILIDAPYDVHYDIVGNPDVWRGVVKGHRNTRGIIKGAIRLANRYLKEKEAKVKAAEGKAKKGGRRARRSNRTRR